MKMRAPPGQFAAATAVIVAQAQRATDAIGAKACAAVFDIDRLQRQIQRLPIATAPLQLAAGVATQLQAGKTETGGQRIKIARVRGVQRRQRKPQCRLTQRHVLCGIQLQPAIELQHARIAPAHTFDLPAPGSGTGQACRQFHRRGRQLRVHRTEQEFATAQLQRQIQRGGIGCQTRLRTAGNARAFRRDAAIGTVQAKPVHAQRATDVDALRMLAQRPLRIDPASGDVAIRPGPGQQWCEPCGRQREHLDAGFGIGLQRLMCRQPGTGMGQFKRQRTLFQPCRQARTGSTARTDRASALQLLDSGT